MSGESRLLSSQFDLDRLDQESQSSVQQARRNEFERIHAMPEYATVMGIYKHTVHDTNEASVQAENNVADMLRSQAAHVAADLKEHPSLVSVESRDFAARYFEASDMSDEAIVAAAEKYREYVVMLGVAATFGLTIAQARSRHISKAPMPHIKRRVKGITPKIVRTSSNDY